MHVYKYGIVIHQRLRDSIVKWKVAIFTGSVSSHGCIDVLPEIFKHNECGLAAGVSVKAKFDDERADHPSVVTTCSDYEWIRDVEVINSNAVIFVIVKIDTDCLGSFFYQENTDILYYIIQNDDTDLRKIAIPKLELDKQLSERSLLQKRDEPLVYRVGVSWNPVFFVGGTGAHWRYYPDLPLVPIFELYYRDTTLPYLSESMTYGVLEGIVIAQNESGALYWTVGMGCAVLSNFTRETEMPPLGSVNYVLVKRCLPEKSFGFPCCYELLPDIRNHCWKGLKIIIDKKNGSVYFEAHSECVQMTEKEGSSLAMVVPNIGMIYRGLKNYKDKISAGRKYYFRVEFRKENYSIVPVIVDLCLDEDVFIKCRVVSASQEMKIYFAVLEPVDNVFQRLKSKVDFIAIPFRVLYCAKTMYVENEELMLDCFTVRTSFPKEDHEVVYAVHVQSLHRSPRDPLFSIFNKTVWIRSMVEIRNISEEDITTICWPLDQIITDYNRLTAGKSIRTSVAVQAEFVIGRQNAPVFWVRTVADTVRQLPKMTQELYLELPTLEEALKLKNGPKEFAQKAEPTSGVFGMDDIKVSDSKIDNRDLNCSQCSEEVVITESYFASTAPSTTTFVQYPESQCSAASCNDIITGEVVTESVFSSSISSFSCDSPKKSAAIEVGKIDTYYPERRTPIRRSMFSYKINPGNRPQVRGFGPSNYNYHGPTSPGNDKKRPRAVKFGSRQLRLRKNHQDVLEDMAYRFMENRLMFVENAKEAIESWSRVPTAKVTKTKKTAASVIPIERVTSHQSFGRNIRRHTSLIRFVVLDKVMNVCDSTVVVPFGGDFPEVPKDFQLGNRYKVEHFSFLGDDMCRFGGFGTGLNNVTFYPETPSSTLTSPRSKENGRGHEYVQFETQVSRPSIPVVHSEIFELWSCEFCPGYVLVQLKPELKKYLETIDPKVYEQYTYSAIIEPLAGGPVEASILVEEEDQNDEMDVFVFWRLVVEFSSVPPVVHLPTLICRGEKYYPTRDYSKREVGGIAVKDYGMWKTLSINSKLAQEKMDRLRAMNDPRIRMMDGPDLKPELLERKVHEDDRRVSMFNAMKLFVESLPQLQENGMFQSVFINDFIAEMEKLKPLHDDNHPHQKKKRIYSLEVGMNYLTKILLTGSTYRIMNDFKEHVPLLTTLAECIGLNTTYIKKTDDVKKMLVYFRKNKLNSCI